MMGWLRDSKLSKITAMVGVSGGFFCLDNTPFALATYQKFVAFSHFEDFVHRSPTYSILLT